MPDSIKKYCSITLILISLLFIFILINIILSLVSKISNIRKGKSHQSSQPMTETTTQVPEQPKPFEYPKGPDEECRDDKGNVSIAKQYRYGLGNHIYAMYFCPPICNDETYKICDPETNNMCCKRNANKEGMNKVSECNFGKKEFSYGQTIGGDVFMNTHCKKTITLE